MTTDLRPTDDASPRHLLTRVRTARGSALLASLASLTALGLLAGCRGNTITDAERREHASNAALDTSATSATSAAWSKSSTPSAPSAATTPGTHRALTLVPTLPAAWIDAAQRFDPVALRTDVADLASDAMAGRHWKEPGGFMAAGWIAARLRQAGFEPGASDGSWFEPLPSHPDAAPNVIGVLPGRTDDIVLVTAHYDHLTSRPVRDDDPPNVDRIFNGADDNASGVAAMLAAAHALHTIASGDRRPPTIDDPYTTRGPSDPFEATVVCVAFSGEEAGLRGARDLAAAPPFPLTRIRAMINMDMISRGDPNTICVEGLADAPVIAAAIDRANEHVGLNLLRDQNLDWLRRSDQGPFLALGVPAVLFSVEDHPDYHQVTDHVERIDAELATRAARLAMLTTALLADAEATSGAPAPAPAPAAVR